MMIFFRYSFCKNNNKKENIKEKSAFLTHFPHLLDKIFTFEQTNSFVFFSLNQIFRTFDFVESTLARK